MNTRKVPRLLLPVYDGSKDYETFLEQSSNERLERTGKRTNTGDEIAWTRKGPNHFSDCNIYAYAVALNLDPFQMGLPFEEAQEAEKQHAESVRGYIPGGDEENVSRRGEF